jgi:hypothetical protein
MGELNRSGNNTLMTNTSINPPNPKKKSKAATTKNKLTESVMSGISATSMSVSPNRKTKTMTTRGRNNSNTPIKKEVRKGTKEECSAINGEFEDDFLASDFNLVKLIPTQNESKLEEEFKKMKKSFTEKINNLKKEYKSINSLESRVKNLEDQLAKKKKTTTKRQKKEVTQEAIDALSSKITEHLDLDQKKGMREIIKDYIKLEKDGSFNFNIYTLPSYKFFELQKYVDKCFTQSFTKKMPKLSINCRTNVRFINIDLIFICSTSYNLSNLS